MLQFQFNVGCDIPHKFLNKELLQLEAEHIYRYVANTVFGKPDPDESDRPTKGRLALLEFANKGILYFMPNKLMKWEVTTHKGNPSKLVIINKLIKRVKNTRLENKGRLHRLSVHWN